MDKIIKAGDIMNENFPIFDCTISLEKCVKKINGSGETACLVIKNGIIHSILSEDDLLKAYMEKNRKKEIGKIKTSHNFSIVDTETTLLEIIRMIIQEEIEFVIVRDKYSLGLITKKEIAESNQKLFDLLSKEIKESFQKI